MSLGMKKDRKMPKRVFARLSLAKSRVEVGERVKVI